MKYYVAPMEGITKTPFRRLHRAYFPGADKYYVPFISPTQEHRFTARELGELLPELNEGIPLIPQLLANSADPFIWAARELKAMGYREVNFNLGCPSRTVVSKRKGSGLLAHLEQLDAILDEIFSALDMDISIKTRLGLSSPEEFGPILALYNKYPIHELTVHPRVQSDYYKLPTRPDSFAPYADAIRAPLCYNGDLFTPADGESIATRFPGSQAMMLGRGLIRNPALIARMQGQPMPERRVFLQFHDELLESYRSLNWSDNAVLCHMKELCSFMADLFENSDACAKRIRKASRLSDYRAAAGELFSLPLKNN